MTDTWFRQDEVIGSDTLAAASPFLRKFDKKALQRILASKLGCTLRLISASAELDSHWATVTPDLPAPGKWSLIRLEGNDVVVWLRCHDA